MKRLVIRLSVLSVVVALGLIAIAQARHGAQEPEGQESAAKASLKVSVPQGTPQPIQVDSKSANPLRAQAESNSPLPIRRGPLPASRAAHQANDEIPAASVVLAQHEDGASGRRPAPTKNSFRLRPENDDRYGSPATTSVVVPSKGTPSVAPQQAPSGQPRQFSNPPSEIPAAPTVSGEPRTLEPPVDMRRARPLSNSTEPTRAAAKSAVNFATNRDEIPSAPSRPSYAEVTDRPVEPARRPEANFDPPAQPDSARPSSTIPSATPVREGAGQPGARQLEGAQTPSLTLQKVAPVEIQVGKECVFTIQVHNVGSAPARDVEIVDAVPQGTTLVRTTPAAAQTADGRLVWKIGDLESGSKSEVEVTLMPIDEGEIGSVATVRFKAEASVRTVATRPELELKVSAPPKVMIGEQVTLDIKISNPGSGAATGVVLLENIPEGLKHPAGSSLEFEVGTLAPGATRDLQLVLTAEKAGKTANLLVAHADANLEVRNTSEFEVVAPALAIGVQGPKRRYLERPAKYVLSVANPGTAAAKNIELTSYLPKGMKFIRANNAGQYDARSHSVSWALDELPAQQAGSVELVAMPIEAGDQQLRVEGTAGGGLADQKQQSVMVEGLAAILFEVADVSDPIEAGGETTYEIRVVNQGSKASTAVRVVCLLPQGMKAISATGPTRYDIEAGRVIFSPLGRLAPKADTTYTIKVQANEPGDQRVRVQILTDEMQSPVTKEESTRVYTDQ